jgi:hypothetical protein
MNGPVITTVVCNDSAGGPCIFDSSILASRSEDSEIVTSLFPRSRRHVTLKFLPGLGRKFTTERLQT